MKASIASRGRRCSGAEDPAQDLSTAFDVRRAALLAPRRRRRGTIARPRILLRSDRGRPAHRPCGARRPRSEARRAAPPAHRRRSLLSITRAASGVAPAGVLPALVLRKSAPSASADSDRDAAAISAAVFSSPLEDHLQHAASHRCALSTARSSAAGLRCRRPAGAPGQHQVDSARRRRRSAANRARRASISSLPLGKFMTAATATPAGGGIAPAARSALHIAHSAATLSGAVAARGQAQHVGLAVLVVRAGQVEAGEREARGLLQIASVHAAVR